MTNKETMIKQMDEYRNELKNAGETHERLMQMLNQQAVKIEQLRGAISAVERLLKENEALKGEPENVGIESAKNTES